MSINAALGLKDRGRMAAASNDDHSHAVLEATHEQKISIDVPVQVGGFLAHSLLRTWRRHLSAAVCLQVA